MADSQQPQSQPPPNSLWETDSKIKQEERNLGENVFAVVSNYNNLPSIQIRQFDCFTKGGKLYPTKTGIVLSPSDLTKIQTVISSVQEMAEHPPTAAKRLRLTPTPAATCKDTPATFLTVQPPEDDGKITIDIRRLLPTNDPRTRVKTQKGITLTLSQWQEFCRLLPELLSIMRDLALCL